MPGRYRQREANEAWDRILAFMDRVYDGYYEADQVHFEFAADFAVDYNFDRNVRYGASGEPEPSIRRFNDLKQAVAEGRVPREEFDVQIALYADYFASHPEMLE